MILRYSLPEHEKNKKINKKTETHFEVVIQLIR